MKPHRRQMRLQWAAITGAPHISQRGWPCAGGTRPRAAPASPAARLRAQRQRAETPAPSSLRLHVGSLHQKKSDSQPMRRPVTLPKVPVAAGRATAERRARPGCDDP